MTSYLRQFTKTVHRYYNNMLKAKTISDAQNIMARDSANDDAFPSRPRNFSNKRYSSPAPDRSITFPPRQSMLQFMDSVENEYVEEDDMDAHRSEEMQRMLESSNDDEDTAYSPPEDDHNAIDEDYDDEEPLNQYVNAVNQPSLKDPNKFRSNTPMRQDRREQQPSNPSRNNSSQQVRFNNPNNRDRDIPLPYTGLKDGLCPHILISGECKISNCDYKSHVKPAGNGKGFHQTKGSYRQT